MTKLILIKAAQTDWHAQGRMVGDTDLQLNEAGEVEARRAAQAVAELGAQSVFNGADEPTKQTASLVAAALALKNKTVDAFREIDLGHWEGLSHDDFRDRFAKVARQWRSDPLSVEPPEGEAVSVVAARLKKGLEKILKRNDGRTIILVLGRFAYATTRCELEDGGYKAFWEYVDGEDQWYVLGLEGRKPCEDSPVGDSKK